MDKLSHTILKRLMAGATVDQEALAEDMGLASHTLRDRVGSMERKGVISGYTPHNDGPAHVWAFIEPLMEGPIPSTLFEHPFVQAAYRGPGRFSLMVRLQGPSINELGEFVSKRFEPTRFKVHHIKALATEEA